MSAAKISAQEMHYLSERGVPMIMTPVVITARGTLRGAK